MDHLADNSVVLIVFEGEDAVEETAVGACVIEGDVEQVYGRILDVRALLASIPIQTVHKVFVFNRGALSTVGVDLMTWWHQGYSKLFACAHISDLQCHLRIVSMWLLKGYFFNFLFNFK